MGIIDSRVAINCWVNRKKATTIRQNLKTMDYA
jgi:hypothetical protein